MNTEPMSTPTLEVYTHGEVDFVVAIPADVLADLIAAATVGLDGLSDSRARRVANVLDALEEA